MGRPLLKNICWTITIVYWVFAFTMTHLPARNVPHVEVNDKVEHYLGYGFLAGALYVSMTLSGKREVAIKVLMILMIYGAIDEWTQALPFIHRDCEFADWCADVAGAATAITTLTIVAWMKSPKERAI